MWKVESVGNLIAGNEQIRVRVHILQLYCDSTIMCCINANTHLYCLLSYMASTTLIGLTAVEELAHNPVHCSSQAPP